MTTGYVEPSQESPELAEAEAVSAAEALGGHAAPESPVLSGLIALVLPDADTWDRLAGRLGLARRCLLPTVTSPDAASSARHEGARGGSAVFRRIGKASGGGTDDAVLSSGRAFKVGGGTIDLESPTRRFWLARDAMEADHLLEEVASVDRATTARRRMPLLPFQRPVSLPPKLARAAVNLAQVKPSDAVLDPFLGTGSLLAEAGLLGGRLFGVDRDATMVRGALQNLAYLGLTAEKVIVGDARDVEFGDEHLRFSAIVTDPPYGRASSTGGTDASQLTAEVVERWRHLLRPAGRILVIVPAGGPALEIPGTIRFRIPVRVHRSLTREFRLYENAG
ncbi:MAG TPA: DNA methyltransferase [Thermoplasmata archaeon]|nr:DNA methyltransferase [Thermoplasmata archaeon]